MKENLSDLIEKLHICIVIPTYNNDKTLLSVIQSVLSVTENVIVVNDGSTDSTSKILNTLSDQITILEQQFNKGKGCALKVGFKEAMRRHFDYVLTMDADGQHKASDIQYFVNVIQQNPNSLIVGSRQMNHVNMPQKNTFANQFSNFWFTIQTAHQLPDTQSGFRIYPLQKMGKMRWFTNRYEMELEILVRCAWKDIRIIPMPIDVYYPPKSERVSHFRPCVDFTRISLLNTVLCVAAILYGYPSIFIRKLLKLILKNA